VASAAAAKSGEAYAQFLLGHRLAENDDEAGAIAAYKRAMELDPQAADIPAELAGLYLQQNKIQDAMTTAEQALKIAPDNREGNRVLGIVYAAMSDGGNDNRSRSNGATKSDEYVTKAIAYLERAIDKPIGDPDPNVRATLARLYLRSGGYDKAVKLLSDLVNQEPGWQDGPMLLAEAYAGAGRTAEAITWLEERAKDDPRMLPALADFYERERRWSDAAAVYARVVQRAPRNFDLQTRYAQTLLNAGGRDNVGKARANQKLSEDRAKSVAAYLIQKFNLKPDQFVVKGYGASKPLVPNSNDLNRGKNRRVEFVVINKDVLKREVQRRRTLQKSEGAPGGAPGENPAPATPPGIPPPSPAPAPADTTKR